MQLKIQRSQRTGGIMGKTVFFALDVRADYTSTEQENITKYKLGSAVIYNSAASRKHLDKFHANNDGSVAGMAKGAVSLAMVAMNLNITMDSLGKGQHIECKDLFELIEAEVTIMEACKNIKQNLALAESFDGRTVLIDFDDEGERVHRSQGMPDLTRHAPVLPPPPTPMLSAPMQIEGRASEAPIAREMPIAREAVNSVPMSSMKPGADSDDEEDESKFLKIAAVVGGAVCLIFLLSHYL